MEKPESTVINNREPGIAGVLRPGTFCIGRRPIRHQFADGASDFGKSGLV